MIDDNQSVTEMRRAHLPASDMIPLVALQYISWDILHTFCIL